MRWVVVGQDDGWAVLCSLTNKMQDMNQNYHIAQGEPRNRRNSIIYIPSSCLHLHSLLLPDNTHRLHPEWSRHLVTCTKQPLSFQNTPNNLHSSVLSLWASISYMQLYHDDNASDVDSFSTHNDGIIGQPPRTGEGKSKDANIGYGSPPHIGSGPYTAIHLGTHPWTQPDTQCLRRQGWVGMGPLIWYNLSWSSHDLRLFTIAGEVATLQEQEIALSGVVGCLPLIYGKNIWQNPRPK